MPLFFLCYFAAGRFYGIKGKNLVLFLFSLVFYAWGEPVYILLMIYSTVLDYVCGRMIESAECDGNQLKKKILTEIKWQKIRINICPKL